MEYSCEDFPVYSHSETLEILKFIIKWYLDFTLSFSMHSFKNLCSIHFSKGKILQKRGSMHCPDQTIEKLLQYIFQYLPRRVHFWQLQIYKFFLFHLFLGLRIYSNQKIPKETGLKQPVRKSAIRKPKALKQMTCIQCTPLVRQRV